MMKYIPFRILTALICLSLLINNGTKCQSKAQSSYINTQKKLKSLHFVSINPNFEVFSFLKTNISILKPENIDELIKKSAAKNNIFIDIATSRDLEEQDVAFINYLAPLRTEILQRSRYQQNYNAFNPPAPANQNEPKENATKKRQLPKISPRFSHLAEKYGTPYFCVQGVMPKTEGDAENISSIGSSIRFMYEKKSENTELIYYNILVDVTKAEILYVEHRNISINISESVLNSILYDTFRNLSQ